MISIQIKNSYTVWRPKTMWSLIYEATKEKYNIPFPAALLNRTYKSMYIEWWLHNIGYYVTLPFVWIKFLKKINLRCKDVDLEQWKEKPYIRD